MRLGGAHKSKYGYGFILVTPKRQPEIHSCRDNSLFIWGLVMGHHKPHIDPVKPMVSTVVWIAAKDVPRQRYIITGCSQLIVTVNFVDVCINCLGKKLSDLAQSRRIQLKVWVHSTIHTSPTNFCPPPRWTYLNEPEFGFCETNFAIFTGGTGGLTVSTILIQEISGVNFWQHPNASINVTVFRPAIGQIKRKILMSLSCSLCWALHKGFQVRLKEHSVDVLGRAIFQDGWDKLQSSMSLRKFVSYRWGDVFPLRPNKLMR